MNRYNDNLTVFCRCNACRYTSIRIEHMKKHIKRKHATNVCAAMDTADDVDFEYSNNDSSAQEVGADTVVVNQQDVAGAKKVDNDGSDNHSAGISSKTVAVNEDVDEAPDENAGFMDNYDLVDPEGDKVDPNVDVIDDYIEETFDEQSDVSVSEQYVVESFPPMLHWNANYFGETRQDPSDYAYMDGKRQNLSTPWTKKDEKLALLNQVYNLQEHYDYFGGLRGTVFRRLNPNCRDYTQYSSFTDGKIAFSILDMLFLKPQ